MTDVAHAPTDKQLAKGPTVTLVRPGWHGNTVALHGFAYPIRFDSGKAVVLKAHADAWITAGWLNTNGVSIIDNNTKAEPPAESPERTRDELYAEAQRLDIPGRSSMTKQELEHAISQAN